MAEFVSLGPCSFSLRRKELATVTILSQILSVIFASLNSLIRKTDRLAPRSERETDGEVGVWSEEEWDLKEGVQISTAEVCAEGVLVRAHSLSNGSEEVGNVYLEGWGGDRKDWQKRCGQGPSEAEVQQQMDVPSTQHGKRGGTPEEFVMLRMNPFFLLKFRW